MCCFLLLRGTKSDFLDFLGEDTPAPGGKTAKLAESSEITVQMNSLRGQTPQLLRGTSGVQPPKTVQKDYINEGTSPDPDGVSCVRPLKVTKAKRF
jgi:hypothetical protein